MKKAILALFTIGVLSCNNDPQKIVLAPEDGRDFTFANKDGEQTLVLDRVAIESPKDSLNKSEALFTLGFDFENKQEIDIIDSAFLELHPYESKYSLAGKNGFFVYKIMEDWDQESISYSKLPKLSKEKAKNPKVEDLNKKVVINVSELIAGEVKDQKVFDFLVRLKLPNPNELQYASFKSSRNEDKKGRPTLTIYGK